jgi:enoyl-CoA hydratase/carnithine racemase
MQGCEQMVTDDSKSLSSSEGDILLKKTNGPLATITLNQPKKLNVLSSQMLSLIQDCLDDLATDKSIRVIVLEANGKAFCTGHDLKDMRHNYTYKYQNNLFAQCSKLMLSIHRLPQPVIAKVNGIATAAGCQLVATCDLAIASTLSSFAVSGINNGLFCTTPGVALSRNLSRKHSMEMLLTGDFISAERAVEVGLINKAVDESLLSISVEELAIKLSEKSFHSLKIGKQAFYQHIEMGISDAYKFASTEMANNVMDKDAAEGFDAFINKRQPVWDQSPRKALVDKDKT